MASLYEIITIIHPNETDEGVEAIVGGLRQQIDTSGGTILSVDPWGRRKLAYPIAKNDEGYYVLIHADGPANLPAEFRAHTKLRDSVMREMVVKLEEPQASEVRKALEEKGPEDEALAAAQLAAAEERAAEKQAALTASVSGLQDDDDDADVDDDDDDATDEEN